ncbi:16488_t:CDS:2, partial [Rhizophagus irregularis]
VEVYKNENDNDNKKFFKINDERIPFEEFKVEQLERLISHRGMFGRSDILILWQVDIDKSVLNPRSTEADIKNLEAENRDDKQLHHIPILANGPGTGKSQFLQELPALLLNHNVDELKNLKILSVNVTFNGGFIALEDEIYAGPASVALRILYKHFLS